MEQNFFGDYKPKDAGELAEATDLTATDPSTAMVTIDKEDDGFHAEIMNDEDVSFSLGPYTDDQLLDKELREAGYQYIEQGF
jgi:hypothetical protein